MSRSRRSACRPAARRDRVGAAPQDELAVRSALVLAEQLGTTPVPFPGEHAGLIGEPGGFADILRQVL